MIAIELSSVGGIDRATVQTLLAARARLSGRTPLALYECTSFPVSWLIDGDSDADQDQRAREYRAGLCARGAGSGRPPTRVVTLRPLDVAGGKRNDCSTSVLAVLVPAPGALKPVRALLDKMMEHTRREAGNHYYNLYDSSEDGSLWMFEAYADAAALQAHRASSYYQTYVPQIAGQLSGAIRVHTLVQRLFG